MNYTELADEIAREIADGRYRPGDRLLPQREFAHRRRVAVSTASRAYAELVRRRLAVGEVGRGTFVRPLSGAPPADLVEPTGARIDLELNFPFVPEQPSILAGSLARLAGDPERLAASMTAASVRGTAAARRAVTLMHREAGWAAPEHRMLFAGNGKQAVAAALRALLRPGDRLGVEAHTYPVVKTVAAQVGAAIVPLPMDAEGITPEAVRAAHQQGPLKALYLQPTLHNPLGATMSLARREQLAAVLEELDVRAVEDVVNAFLSENAPPPLASLAPERVVLLDSLSKRLSPGLTIGMLVCPDDLVEPVTGALRAALTGPQRFALEACTLWLEDGSVARLSAMKRLDAARRRALAERYLQGAARRIAGGGYHCWLELPEAWRAESFVAAAARRQIALTPGGAFTTKPGHTPNAVRLALASPPLPLLECALRQLCLLLNSAPESWPTE
jgi:DNA-binding transcriptional MocR family regulator